MQKITKSTVLPTEIIDKINELVDYKQNILTPNSETITITEGVYHTTLTAICSNQSATVTNNYTETKESLGTIVETYTAQNKYGWKFVNNYKIHYNDSVATKPTLNTTTGITNFISANSYYVSLSTVGDFVICHFIVGSDKSGTQYLANTLDTNLKLSEVSNYSSLTQGSDLYIKIQRTGTNKIQYSYSLNGNSYTSIKTSTGGSGNTQDWVEIGWKDDATSSYYKGTMDCKTSYLYDNNGTIITAFAIPDTNNIIGLEWTLYGSVSGLPQGVSVSNAAAGNTLTCTYVTEQVTEIATKNRADTDLSNLSTIGNLKLCGNFVQEDQNVISSTSLSGSSNLNKKSVLEAYLPDDDYTYLVLVCADCDTGTSSSNYFKLSVNTGANVVRICQARTRSNSSVMAGGGVWIPVDGTRKFEIVRNSNFNGTATVDLKGYWRIM